jgi:collagen triple helix repeat protein
MRFPRPSAATIITMAALFFALGGTAVASHFLITSTGQIKPSVLKTLRGSNGPAGPAGVQGATGATGSAGPEGPVGKEGPSGKEGARGPEGKEGKEGKEGPSGGPIGPEGKEGREGPAGPEGKEGPEGPEGKEGKEGPPAKLSAMEPVRGEPAEVSPGEQGASFAYCPPGKRPVSGGFFKDGPQFAEEFSEAFVSEVAPGEFESGWLYGGSNPASSEATDTVEAVAYCAGEGEAVEASRVSAARRREVKAALLAQIRSRHRHRAHARVNHAAHHH